MSGPNQWPDPALLPQYKAATEAYFCAIFRLGRRLLQLLAAALELPEDWFDDKYSTSMATLRPLRYSGRPSAPEKGVCSTAAQYLAADHYIHAEDEILARAAGLGW
jgi:isopenicillin N synthase-like dioxygenase